VHHGSRRKALAIGAGMFAIVIVVAGCSSSGSSKAADTSPTTTTAAGNTTAGNTAGSGSGTVSVDIVITGERPATIKGTKGQCSLPSNETSPAGYNFSGSDYPSLGAGGNFGVTGPQKGPPAFPSSIKVLINGGGYLDTDGHGITISADRKKVTINADIGGLTSSGTTVHELVKGTITCS
jgi:hypothetical protein